MRFTSGYSVSTSTAMGRFAITGVGLLSVLVWPAFQSWQIPPAVRRAAGGIHATDLERQVRFLASDAMLGRAAPSRELDSAAAYIAAELTGARVRPLGDRGSYFQHLRFEVNRPDSSCSFAEVDAARFAATNDVRFPIRGVPSPRPVSVHGALVYVQHGWVNKTLGIDPYDGLDLRGKIAVTTAYPGGGERLQRDRARADDFVPPWDAAAQRGAIAQVEISGFGEREPTVTPSTWSPDGTSLVASWMPQERAFTRLPRVAVSRRVADALFLTERHSATELISGAVRGESSPSFALNPSRDLQLAICTRAGTDSSSARNVISVIEGSDPVLKHEYIVIGAHYDGQGLQLPAVHGDSIMNSAEDNASGSAGLMQIARAFARGPRPKRSVIFAWFTWEEMSYGQARLGSKFFVSHPPIALGAIKAMLNLDEIGLVPSDAAGVITLGFNANTALRDVALATNAAYLKVGFRSENWGDAAHSDRGAFAQKGIPYLAFEADGGDDHSVTDEAQLIDYRALERLVRTAYVIAWRVANEK